MNPASIALGFGIVLLAVVAYYTGYRAGHAAAIEAFVFVARVANAGAKDTNARP